MDRISILFFFQIENGIDAHSTDNDAGSEKKLILATKQISKILQENIRELKETKKSMETVAEKVSKDLIIYVNLFCCKEKKLQKRTKMTPV